VLPRSKAIARNLDNRRRLVLPETFPPGTAVIMTEVEEDTIIVRRHKPDSRFKTIVVPVIKKLPDDPDWEKTERKLAKAAKSKLPPPE
jgi:hypothetical protein